MCRLIDYEFYYFYGVCDFELRKQLRLNERYIALTSSREHIQSLAYEAAI